jgi:hypothetical protein
MSLTGKLGTIDSQPGNIEFGLSVDLNLLVTQSIAFVQLATGDSHRFEQSQSLSFVQVASAVVHRPASVSQALAFVSLAAQGTVFPKSASNTLALVGAASAVRNIPVSVSQSLGLTHAVVVRGPIYKTATNTLALVQVAAEQGPIYQTIHDHLNFAQTTHQSDIHVYATNILTFSQSAGRVINVSVSQSIAFTQAAARKNIITQALAFTQLAKAGKGGDVEQELDFVQTVQIRGVFQRSQADTLGLVQSVTYYIDRGCTRFAYTPFVGGAGDPNYTPPTTVEPTLGSHKLRLTYPFTSPSLSLTLTNPAFGDKDRLNFNRINRETRGGTLVIFADPKWPKTQTLAVQVDNLNPNQAEDMIAFLRTSLGKEIGLLDWENRLWRGIVTTPDARITHVGRHDRSIAFEFQGELV